MTKLRSIILASAAAGSLAALGAACGSYSSPPTGTGGSSAMPGGGADTSGGRPDAPAAGAPTSIAGADTNGGSTDMPSGGSGGSPTIAGAGGDVASGGAATSGAGGAIGVGGGAGTGAAGGPSITLPCSVLSSGGTKCVSAHSTVRVIVAGYTGPLYQLCKGTIKAGPSSCKGTAQDIGVKDGYADSAAHDAFCGTGACKITKIYDQSGMKNDLEPAPLGGAKGTPDYPADASAAPIKINGHTAYGILITSSASGTGSGYRTGCTDCNIKTGNGMATGDAPQTLYWVTSQKNLNNGCCFDYGNAETSSRDDKNGTMEALYFGGGVAWGTGFPGCASKGSNSCGPWIEADLEDGLYAGWENKQDQAISTNKVLKFDFVTGVLLGDTADKNAGAGRFALYGGDATTGTLQTMYDSIRPQKQGYVPMAKKGSIILGIGGDNSNSAGGLFYEGAIATGPVISKASVDALQAAVVATRYGK